VSNRTRIEKPEALLDLPSQPPIERHKATAARPQDAYHARNGAADNIHALQDRTARGEI
jgi:hypothetical protein